MIKNPEKRTISEILRWEWYKLSIPQYQRYFDWWKSEIQELMNDLSEVPSDRTRDLFLGSVILDISDISNYKIVDGQQRLTTISLVIIAIRQRAKFLDNITLANHLQQLVKPNLIWDDNGWNKIIVSENIRSIFEYISTYEWDWSFPDKIDWKTVKKQVNKIKPIFSFIFGELSKFGNQELMDFSKALLQSYVILIQAEDIDDVFSIFERTNARGLDLNIWDLLKNFIFSNKEIDFEDKWSEIIDNAWGWLQRMLKYYWISRKWYILQKELYKSLRSYVKCLDNPSSKWVDIFIWELYLFSRYYKVSISQDHELIREWLEEVGLERLSKNEDYYKRISRVFQALKLFRVTQPLSLIYSIFVFYKKSSSANEAKLFEVLEAIEYYHFINNVVSTRIGNDVEKFYAKKAEYFFHCESDFSEAIDDLLMDLRVKKASWEEFISNFWESITYANKQLVHYVFDRINNYWTKGSQYVELFSPEKGLEIKNYNIEHILAQSNKNTTIYTDLELENFDKIGNLLVISRHTNSVLQDKIPKDKIQIIKSDKKNYGNLRYMDDFIVKYEEWSEKWDFEVINKRSLEIANIWYEKVWNF